MSKEILFEKIRREEVVLWIGAGLSISSGFPSGDRLKEIIYESLTENEKAQIDQNSSLDVLADNVVALRSSKNHLIDILNKVFSKLPIKDSIVHKNLALIPHFKTIITTNYDCLIENSIKNSISIYNEKRIPYINNDRKRKIIKVHGDLNDPDSLIITKEDYYKLIGQNGLNSAIWTLVKNCLASNSVLFVGYSVEDSNLLTLLSDLELSIGINRKEYFFVSPNISLLKKKHLERRNILYIDSTGEKLIEELIQNIKDNIDSDLRSNIVSADTFKDFMNGLDLIPTLSVRNNIFEINNIQSKNPIEIKGEFIISDKKVADDLYNHFINPSSEGFILDESVLQGFNMWFSGVKWDLTSSTSKLEFLPIPIHEGFIDVFFEDGFAINLHASVFSNRSGVDIKLKHASGEIIIKLKNLVGKVNAELNVKHNPICSNVFSEIQFFNFLVKVNNQESVTIITETNKRFIQKLTKTKWVEEFNWFLDYFKKLEQVEQFFKVKFKKFSVKEINKYSTNSLSRLLAIMNEDDFQQDVNFFTFSVDNQAGENLEKDLLSQKVFLYTYTNEESIILHSYKFDVGAKSYNIVNPQFTFDVDKASGNKVLKMHSFENPVKVKYLIPEKVEFINN